MLRALTPMLVEIDRATDAHSILHSLDERGFNGEIVGSTSGCLAVRVPRGRRWTDRRLTELLQALESWLAQSGRHTVAVQIDDLRYRLTRPEIVERALAKAA